VDWGQKAPATFRTKKKSKKPPKIPPKGHFLSFLWEIGNVSATYIALPLWPVRPCKLDRFLLHIANGLSMEKIKLTIPQRK
jgi:hypothetical protein